MKANHLNTSPWAKGKLFSFRFFEKKKNPLIKDATD